MKRKMTRILLGIAALTAICGGSFVKSKAAPYEYLEELHSGGEYSASAKWASGAIHYAYAEGIVAGKDEIRFDPDSPVTRAEAVAMLVNMKGIDITAESQEYSFTDIDNAWYTPYIASAYANGLVAGKSETVFDPNGKLTRAEAATMIVKSMGYDIISESDASFENEREEVFEDESDASFEDKREAAFEDISDAWYTNYIKTAYERGIVAGKSETTFDPEQNVTRAEFARMIYNCAVSEYEAGIYFAIMFPDGEGSFALKSGDETIFSYDAETKEVTGEVTVKSGTDWKMVHFDGTKKLEMTVDSDELKTVRIFAAGKEIGVSGTNVGKVEVDENGAVTLHRKAEIGNTGSWLETYNGVVIESADGDSVNTSDAVTLPQWPMGTADTPYQVILSYTGGIIKPSPNGIHMGDVTFVHAPSQWFRFTQQEAGTSFVIRGFLK